MALSNAFNLFSDFRRVLAKTQFFYIFSTSPLKKLKGMCYMTACLSAFFSLLFLSFAAAVNLLSVLPPVSSSGILRKLQRKGKFLPRSQGKISSDFSIVTISKHFRVYFALKWLNHSDMGIVGKNFSYRLQNMSISDANFGQKCSLSQHHLRMRFLCLCFRKPLFS